MGRSVCCDKMGLKKGPWTPEEDQKLLAYIEENGHGSWRALPSKAGLQRCGKSCRLRWTNYLRPDIKRGKFSLQEEQTIIQLHALLGNRWSAIATHLPKRTDNEIKNYWNTHLKKRLARMGLDPVTHKPKNGTLLSSNGPSKNAAKLSHMAQWESARLEAEARLARESKIRLNYFKHQLNPSLSPDLSPTKVAESTQMKFKSWTGSFSKSSDAISGDLESPTSTPTLSDGTQGVTSSGVPQHSKQLIEVKDATPGSPDLALIKQEGVNEWKGLEGTIDFEEIKEGIGNKVSFTASFHEIMVPGLEGQWYPGAVPGSHNMESQMEEGFSGQLLNNSGDRSLSDNEDAGRGSCEDNKNYWNSILNFVNSSPSESPMF
ncbi:hypothetical protein MLD38_024513 [Melastoma candidum]|uniref:Uncharacterized protein n=1 Tax=Melastoma candidum TaxID=119954 RepID=A0ACB9NVJ6_9MYRT|nr:hypothetical protein MLD38_024513 [Melastoma candidum]